MKCDYCSAVFFPGISFLRLSWSSLECEYYISVLICRAYSYHGGPDLRKLNPRIISSQRASEYRLYSISGDEFALVYTNTQTEFTVGGMGWPGRPGWLWPPHFSAR